MKDIQTVESITETEDGKNIRAVVVFDKQKLADEFIPYYAIQEKISEAVLPILVKDVLKDKDKIVKQVLKGVNWSDLVRSEVAKRVIQEVASGR